MFKHYFIPNESSLKFFSQFQFHLDIICELL